MARRAASRAGGPRHREVELEDVRARRAHGAGPAAHPREVALVRDPAAQRPRARPPPDQPLEHGRVRADHGHLDPGIEAREQVREHALGPRDSLASGERREPHRPHAGAPRTRRPASRAMRPIQPPSSWPIWASSHSASSAVRMRSPNARPGVGEAAAGEGEDDAGQPRPRPGGSPTPPALPRRPRAAVAPWRRCPRSPPAPPGSPCAASRPPPGPARRRSPGPRRRRRSPGTSANASARLSTAARALARTGERASSRPVIRAPLIVHTGERRQAKGEDEEDRAGVLETCSP